MPDIFISYKQEERTVASRLAMRLTELGYDVWWDAALLAGERFEDEIAGVLKDSRAVVILWSRRAIDSDWVKAEAETARQQKKALPTVIDDVPLDNLPLLFRGLHVAGLRGWEGEEDHPGYTELLKSLRDRLGAAKGPTLSEPQAEAKLARSVSEAEVWSEIVSAPTPSLDEYRAYLERYGPNGRFAELARLRIGRLERAMQQTRPAVVTRRGRIPFLLAPILAAVLLLGAGTLWAMSSGLVAGLMTPPDVRDAVGRCVAWSTSARTDAATGLPQLESGIDTACARAVEYYPKGGDYIGMLAMVRVEQGSTHADEAISLANRGIDLKSATANLALASMYRYGVNLPLDVQRAGTYYKAASDLGLARASARLCLHAIDLGFQSAGLTPGAFLTTCDAAADAGDPVGQLALGLIRETGGDGKPVDYAGAAELYRRAVDQKSPEAEILLGSLYERGLGVDRDASRAFALYSSAADAGFPEALRRLGVLYELGVGTTKDVNHAAQLYETASVKGDLVALFLADYGIAPNILATFRSNRELDRLASNQSNEVGQRLLGILSDRGFLRPLDPAKALSLFTQCATAGNALCQFALGAYQQARMNAPDKALPLYKQAADQGNMYGQYWLAYLYDLGLGVPVDTAKAMSLYKLAAAQGHLSAINRLQQLSQTLPAAAASN